MNMKNIVLWDVTVCGSCRSRQLYELRWLVTAEVPSSPILFTLMMEVICSSEKLAFTRATRHKA
jgi:hypothetical protein